MEGRQRRTPEHACEGRGGGPGFDSAGVGREDRAADVVRTDEGDNAALDDRDRVPAVPDIFADQRAGGLVVLGGAANRGWTGGVPGAARGGSGGRGRGGGFCSLRWEVSTVDSFDRGSWINGLVAGIRVGLRMRRGWLGRLDKGVRQRLSARQMVREITHSTAC